MIDTTISELVKFSDLDARAIEALKELDDEGALAVLKQFTDSNLQVGWPSNLYCIVSY